MFELKRNGEWISKEWNINNKTTYKRNENTSWWMQLTEEKGGKINIDIFICGEEQKFQDVG